MCLNCSFRPPCHISGECSVQWYSRVDANALLSRVIVIPLLLVLRSHAHQYFHTQFGPGSQNSLQTSARRLPFTPVRPSSPWVKHDVARAPRGRRYGHVWPAARNLAWCGGEGGGGFTAIVNRRHKARSVWPGPSLGEVARRGRTERSWKRRRYASSCWLGWRPPMLYR